MGFSILSGGAARQLRMLALMMRLQARIMRKSGQKELGCRLAERARAMARAGRMVAVAS